MHRSSEESAGPSRPRPGAAWLMLAVLAAIQFSHVTDFIIIMPLGPRYLRELAIGPPQFGLLVSAYAFSACVSGLLAASLIDRFDRKRALLFLGTGFTAGTLACAVAPTYEALLVARCAAGAFGGVLNAVVLATVGDAFPEERRGLAMGVVMSAFSVAIIAGVPAGLALAAALGTGAPFAVLGGLSAFVLLLAAFALPPLRGHLDDARPGGPAWAVLVRPAHLRAYALTTSLVLSTFVLAPHLATFLVVNVGWAESDLASLYFCGGAATLVTMSLFGRLADRVGKLPVFRVLALLNLVPVLWMVNLGPTPVAATLVLTTLYFVLSSGRMVPATALITSSAAPSYRGSFMSVNSSVQQLAAGLASLLAGVLLHQPVKDGPLEGYPLVGLVAAVMTAAALFLAGQVRPADGAEPEAADPAAGVCGLDPVDAPVPLAEPARGVS